MTEISPISADLKALREEADMSYRAVAEELGVPLSKYSHYELRYKKPYLPMELAQNLAQIFGRRGISRDRVLALAGGSDVFGALESLNEPEDSVTIDRFAVSASAGFGVIPDDYPEVADQLTFPRQYLRTITSTSPKHLSIIGVKGDSMLDTLQHDDVVMIDRSKTSLAYDGLFVLNLDGALHVKRVTRGSKPGMISIVSDNRAKYSPFERAAEEVVVVGKVIWKGVKE